MTSTLANPNASALCWACGAISDGPFCPDCGKVQPIKVQPTKDADYFEVFSLPRLLQIDTADLEKRFYRLSRKLHPDVFARASAEEQQWSLDRTSLLNDAYRALKDPVARTEYLLEIEGAKIEDPSAAARKQQAPPDLLEEVFELNLQLEEMRMGSNSGDQAAHANDPDVERDLQAARARFEALLAESESQLSEQWSAWDSAETKGDAQSKDATKESMLALLRRRSYIRNLVRDVREALGV